MIRPAYWTDSDLHTRLTAECREFYIGLWMEADDAGYVAWDVDRIGADLYPYRTLAWRRARIERWMEQLAVNGHVVALGCGRHVAIPNLSKHQAPPKPSYQHQKAHATCMRQMAPDGASGGQRAPAQGFSREGKGIEGEGRGLKGVRRGANGLTTDDDERGALYAALSDRDLPVPA
jgi:hypothetical protein